MNAEWMISIPEDNLAYLLAEAERVVKAARAIAPSGTPSMFYYYPDGLGFYRGVWTRDFAYIVENVPELLPAKDIKAVYYAFIRHQRPDGGIAASIAPNGTPYYLTVGNPEFTDSDNSQFLVKIIYAYWRKSGDLDLFASTVANLERAMNHVRRNSQGLVWLDPENPHCGYGFTDSVIKTGSELFCSLLYWEACRLFADLCNRIGRCALADDLLDRARAIELAIGMLRDDKTGALFATSESDRRVDIWGNAYLAYIGFPLGDATATIGRFLAENYDRYVYEGQVRHLLRGEYWSKLIYDVPRGTYQNGAYWGTASGWVMYALAQHDKALASKMAADLVDSYRERGIFECIGHHYTKCKDYVASIVNPVGAIKRMLGIQEIPPDPG